MIPLEEPKPAGAESGELPSSSGAAAAAAGGGSSGMAADMGAVPQGMYYGAVPAMGQYQQQHSSVLSPDSTAAGAAGAMGAVPDMAAAAAAAGAGGEPPVAAVSMFEQWASEGQLESAGRQQPQ